MHWLKIKHAYAEVKKKSCKEKFKLSYMQCNDTYHIPYGEGSGFESGAGLSIPLVRLSTLDGVLGYDTFFHHTLLGVVGVSTSIFSDSRNFLHWILRFAYLWL